MHCGGDYPESSQEEVKTWSQIFGNVHVTATKLCKLQKETYKHILNSVVGEYVKKKKFLLLLSSWGRHESSTLQ
jgi:hypothetical protein